MAALRGWCNCNTGCQVMRLEDAGVAKAALTPVTSLAAYELTLRGFAIMRRDDPTETARAQDLFKQAIAKDPIYSLAHASNWPPSIGRTTPVM